MATLQASAFLAPSVFAVPAMAEAAGIAVSQQVVTGVVVDDMGEAVIVMPQRELLQTSTDGSLSMRLRGQGFA